MQRLIEEALARESDDDDPLYLVAMAVEQDSALAEDMAAWESTVGDGLDASTLEAW